MSSRFGPADGQELCNKQATHREGLEGGEKGFPEGSPLRLQLSDPQTFGVAASKKILINNNFKYLIISSRLFNIGAAAQAEETPLAGWWSPLIPPLPQNQHLPRQGGSFQGKEPNCLGERRSAALNPAFPHPIPVPAGPGELRALSSPGRPRFAFGDQRALLVLSDLHTWPKGHDL